MLPMRDGQQVKIVLLSFWSVNRWVSQYLYLKISLIVRLRHPACLLSSQRIRKSDDNCRWFTIKSLYFIQYINIKTSEWIQSLFCGRMLISCTLNLTERVCHLRGSPTWLTPPLPFCGNVLGEDSLLIWGEEGEVRSRPVIGCGGEVFACVRHRANTYLPSTPTYHRHLNHSANRTHSKVFSSVRPHLQTALTMLTRFLCKTSKGTKKRSSKPN